MSSNLLHEDAGIAFAVSDQKRLNGQFFTTSNPFANDLFLKWLKRIPNKLKTEFLEPFAGSNNIVVMLRDLGFSPHWRCYDLEPVNDERNSSGFEVELRDTLAHMPEGLQVAITNPPYLAKNSATRRGLPYPKTQHDDVYKFALDRMLDKIGYVAAIIPESFLTQDIFHHRLFGVVSLTCRMFEETEVPVCLALFVPSVDKQNPIDFEVYAENRKIGQYQSLKKHLRAAASLVPWEFNCPTGSIGLRGVDGNKGPTIKFVKGSDIDRDEVKSTSRARTRIAGCPAGRELEIINTANELLAERRVITKDVFMTSFKGLRADGQYRRRLDYSQARDLLNLAIMEVGV